MSVIRTIPQQFFEVAKRQGSRPGYYEKKNGAWQATSWQEFGNEVKAASKALIALGASKKAAAILGFNRPEWVIMDMAAMCAGGVAAGIYATSSPTEVQYVANHCEAHVILVENAKQWEKVKAERHNLPHLQHVVAMRAAGKIAPEVLSWEEFIAKGKDVPDAEIDAHLLALEPDGLATLIYTSGTTGPPKGVMLSHDNLYFTATMLIQVVDYHQDSCALSYLPLSHIAEQMVTIHGPAITGASIYFAESLEKIADNLKEVQPTLVFGVPRIWEKFHSGVSEKLEAATGLKKALISWVRAVCTKRTDSRNRGETPPPWVELQYKLAQKIVLTKLKAALGLSRAEMCISGAAPIGKEVVEFFGTLDIIVREVYGQSEGSGPTTLNRPGKTKFGSVGAMLPGVEVKIAEDGEICVRGRNVFMGYLKDDAATAETLKDGWLLSGDLGQIDSEGFLHITGRKKEIIITAGGKNISPKNLEAGIKQCRLVSEAVVIGDRRKFLAALVTLDESATEHFLAEHGITEGKPFEKHQIVKNEVQKAVDHMNKDLAQVETVKKFTILSRPFSMEQGELTPTLKIKRKIVDQNFGKEIEAMYQE